MEIKERLKILSIITICRWGEGEGIGGVKSTIKGISQANRVSIELGGEGR